MSIQNLVLRPCYRAWCSKHSEMHCPVSCGGLCPNVVPNESEEKLGWRSQAYLKQLSQVRAFDEEVLKIVMPHVTNLLFGMPIQDTSCRSCWHGKWWQRKTWVCCQTNIDHSWTKITWRLLASCTEATKLQGIIDWTVDGIYEPLLSCGNPTDQLSKYIEHFFFFKWHCPKIHFMDKV